AGIAIYATITQLKSYQAMPFAHSLGAFHYAIIQVPMAASDTENMVASILQEDLAATRFSMAAHHIQALFQPVEWSGWWRRWALSDELIVDVIPAGSQEGELSSCTLNVSVRPLSRFLYGFAWIDNARNFRRLHRFQELLAERMTEENSRKEAVRKSDSIETRLAQAELLLLRAQVEPHFLFNTLAHLRELVRTGDGATSLAMLDHLIAYSRSVSDRIRQSTHRLDQELEAAKGYLSLMQIRFADRLKFDFQVNPEIEDCEVPVGCLLIPIENAIKHGIEPRRSQGCVKVQGKLEDGFLSLAVQDDGPGLSPDSSSGRGTGLANLRERLKLLYSDQARLAVEDHDEGGVEVRVLMPVWRRQKP
ncbi:MAG: histidine kinase, partial [Holophaga sp.]|nr:histidine kinase [Holophaga sp.]